MISNTQNIFRPLVAAALGALVGYERENTNQPAGLCTHIILVAGATLSMTLSINLAMKFHSLVSNGEPARLAITFKMKEGALIDERLAELTELEGIRVINFE